MVRSCEGDRRGSVQQHLQGPRAVPHGSMSLPQLTATACSCRR
jgi:hypothetical protein